VEQISYDPHNGEFSLKIRGIGGDKVYYDIGAEPTTASAEAPANFVTKEPHIQFVCVDSTKEHPTGSAQTFIGSVPLKSDQRASVNGNLLQLQTHKDFEIRYTTDGSNPKENGGIYSGEIPIPKNCKFVRTVVTYQGKTIEEKNIAIAENMAEYKLQINDNAPLEYEWNKQKKYGDTETTYLELGKLKQLEGTFIRHFTVVLSQKTDHGNYMELSTAKVPYDPDNLQATIDLIRETAFKDKEVTVLFDYKTILFSSGSQFKKWIELNKYDVTAIQQEGTIKQ
jgi:hypothetical protein